MEKKGLTAKKLVLIALFTALIMVSTLVVRIPIALGYVNLGDAFIFLAVFALGPYGIIAAALGSALADVVGYIAYAPATLVIKGAMAFVVWIIYRATGKVFKKDFFAESLGCVLGVIVMAFGSFLYESVLYGVALAVVNLPWNLLQGAVGLVLSVTIMRIAPIAKLLKSIE